MKEEIHLHEICSCHTCQQLNEAEKKLHLSISENSRREFLRTAGKLGLGLGIGGGLITPLAAAAMHNDDSADKARSIENSRAVRNGKAQVLTLLHTADIHSQLEIHDEFFIENGNPVYKKKRRFCNAENHDQFMAK